MLYSTAKIRLYFSITKPRLTAFDCVTWLSTFCNKNNAENIRKQSMTE